MACGWQLAAIRRIRSSRSSGSIGIAPDGSKLGHELLEGHRGAPGTPTDYDTEAPKEPLVGAAHVRSTWKPGFGGAHPRPSRWPPGLILRGPGGGGPSRDSDPANRTCGHIVNVGKQKRDKVLVPRTGLAGQAQGHQGGRPGHRCGRRHHRADRLDRRRAARAVAGRREDGDRGRLGSGRAGRGRDLARVQQHRARPAAGVRRGRPEVLSRARCSGFNLSPSLYFGKAKKAGTLITNQQLGRPGLHPPVLDACSTSGRPAWRWRRAPRSS